MLEKVEYHTPEEKEACDLIKQHRKYQRYNYLQLYLCDIIETEKGHNVCVDIRISINKNTNHVGVCCNLRCGRRPITMRTNQQLKCTNQHAIDFLKQHKSFYNHDRAERSEFYYTLEPNIGIIERIYYYVDTGNVGCASWVSSRNGKKIKYIDEK